MSFRGYWDVYALSLAVMKAHREVGLPINEGIAFEEVRCQDNGSRE